MKQTRKSRFFSGLLTVLAILLSAPVFILFSPLVVLYLCALPFIRIRERKFYRKTRYFRDFHAPYQGSDPFQKRVTFYESVKKSGLPARYEKKDPLEYVVYGGIIYVLPDFPFLDYNGDKEDWEFFFNYAKRKRTGYREYLASVSEQLRQTEPGLPIRVLLDPEQLSVSHPSPPPFPESLFVSDYAHPLEFPFPMKASECPENIVDAYRLIRSVPDLCGKLSLQEEKAKLVWDFGEFNFEIFIDKSDCAIFANQNPGNGKDRNLTHWHPETVPNTIRDLLEIGKPGHITVISASRSAGAFLYAGRKEDCPYLGRKYRHFQKLYFIEAKQTPGGV